MFAFAVRAIAHEQWVMGFGCMQCMQFCRIIIIIIFENILLMRLACARRRRARGVEGHGL